MIKTKYREFLMPNISCRTIVSALSDWTPAFRLFLLAVYNILLTSNRRYAQALASTFQHHDEYLNERADINEASLYPPRTKAGLYTL